jgi:hypothetical protein
MVAVTAFVVVSMTETVPSSEFVMYANGLPTVRSGHITATKAARAIGVVVRRRLRAVGLLPTRSAIAAVDFIVLSVS